MVRHTSAKRTVERKAVISTHAFDSNNSYEIISTAIINIYNKNNQPLQARVLLDNGSTTNYMTKELSDKLELPLIETNPFVVTGINNCKSTASLEVKTKISSIHMPFKQNLTFLVLDKITENTLTSTLTRTT